jgi:threonine dehydrogenase-like Zn-dependent dehydrogenase
MTDHDVIVVGGGPAGCSAALFAARYGLDTAVFDRGNSSLRQCAFVENYLGFPGGIDVDTLYAMMHAHVERVGGAVVDDMVEALGVTNEEFRIGTLDGRTATADRVVAASTYDVSYLHDLLSEHVLEEGGEEYLDPDLAGERGSTPVDGLYLAGPLAGVDSQIAVSVGHGARVGLEVVTDYRRTEEGWWDAAADHTDWVVADGRYEGEDWLENIAEYHAEAAPDDLDEEYVERRARELAAAQQGWQIPEAEVDRRTERAHRRLLDHVDDRLIVERARDLGAEGDQPEVPE